MWLNNILETIGNTPLIKINNITKVKLSLDIIYLPGINRPECEINNQLFHHPPKATSGLKKRTDGFCPTA